MELDAWDPLDPDQVADLFEPASFPWWLAGGWAIDRHVGAETRPHADIDVLVTRSDLADVRRHLAGWDLSVADPPGSLRAWPDGEALHHRAHDVWCRRTPSSPWSLQLMVDDVVDATWVYRRDGRVTRAVDRLAGPASTGRLPVLAPEVQLLYKSARPRSKDEADFETALPHLEDEARRWLRGALATTDPGHHWLASL